MSTKALCLALLVVLFLAAGCGRVPGAVPGQELPTTVAYPPPPARSPEPTFPPPPSMTPWPTVPTTATPSPLPGPTKPVIEPTPVLPFPTPAVPPPPIGERPAELQTIWYPYYPSPDSRPVLQAVLVDAEGRRWGDGERSIDLGLRAGFPGPTLDMLYASPSGRYIIADFHYGDVWARSYWVDPAVGEAKPITTDPGHESFLAWGSDRQVFAQPSDQKGEIWLVELTTSEHRVFSTPGSGGSTSIAALATSPDGSSVADAIVVYGQSESHPGPEVEIGLQPFGGGPRVLLATLQLPGGAEVLGHSLIWSPDGKKLALVLLAGVNDRDPLNDESQIWLVDADSGSSSILVDNVYHLAGWSPDGEYIAFIRAESAGDKSSSANLWLWDLATSKEIQLTRFASQRVTSAAWAPNGRQMAFGVTLGDYGEVWVTRLDGTEQYPVAGPTGPDAPVVWLREAEGGQ